MKSMYFVFPQILLYELNLWWAPREISSHKRFRKPWAICTISTLTKTLNHWWNSIQIKRFNRNKIHRIQYVYVIGIDAIGNTWCSPCTRTHTMSTNAKTSNPWKNLFSSFLFFFYFDFLSTFYHFLMNITCKSHKICKRTIYYTT